MTTYTLDQSRFLSRIGYDFKNPNLFFLALTHRSVHKSNNYERLEFLGDALLSTIIAEELYTRFPSEQEGQLTRKRATLVRQETLASIAKDLELGKLLLLGLGERKAGGRNRASILSDVVESLIGAIYLDCNDLILLRKIVLTWYDAYLSKVDNFVTLKDAKSRLQEYLQAHKLPLPVYTLNHVEGKAPNQTFHVSCTVENIDAQIAVGSSRRIAEQNAAETCLSLLSSQQA